MVGHQFPAAEKQGGMVNGKTTRGSLMTYIIANSV